MPDSPYCPRCGTPTDSGPSGLCEACAAQRPPERGARELFEGPLPSQARRLAIRLALFAAAGIAALFYELAVRRQGG